MTVQNIPAIERLVELSTDMLCVCREGLIAFINPAGALLLGTSKDEAGKFIGQRLADFVQHDYRDIIESGLSAMADENRPMPLKFIRPDGSLIDIEMSVVALDEEGGEAFMIEGRDVTERNVTERNKVAEAVREREQRLQGIMDSVADAIVTADQDGLIQSFNPAAQGVFGYSPTEVLGKNLNMLMPEPFASEHDGYLKRFLTEGPRIIGKTVEVRGKRKDGVVFPLEINITELRRGKERLFIGVIRDISERKKSEERMKLSAAVFETTSEAIMVTDVLFRVTAVNPAFTLITGYTAEDVVGTVPEFLTAGIVDDPEFFNGMWETVNRTGHAWNKEIWNYRKTGERYAEQRSISAIRDEGDAVRHYVIVFSDITQRKMDEERIWFQANYDTLTRLPNRTLFLEKLAESLIACGATRHRCRLFLVGLDNFKLINDTLGHMFGDRMLQEVARRLHAASKDTYTISRLGGDEFVVVAPELDDPRQADNLARSLISAIEQPFDLEGFEAFVSASVGISTYPDDSEDPSGLLKSADTAMVRAKEQGRARYLFFSADLNSDLEGRLAIKNGLFKALDRKELSLAYQPKVDLKSGRIRSVEALIRWNSAELGFVSPGQFIPILEETNLIGPIGEWVLETACRQHRAWTDAGLPGVRVAVNLSIRQLRPGFVQRVRDILKETGIGPDGIELEVTESLLMKEAETLIPMLQELADMGIHLALDDFGTGYSSLSYLRRFTLHTVKIDRSFIIEIANNRDDAEIVRTIIGMSHALRRRVVAEGVETQDQLAVLRASRCDEIQGYLFSQPLPAEKVTDLLHRQPWSETPREGADKGY
jgi:diguanylate cyclase (GGDEF)-like protein/PAS domain S-box-containing protein